VRFVEVLRMPNVPTRTGSFTCRRATESWGVARKAMSCRKWPSRELSITSVTVADARTMLPEVHQRHVYALQLPRETMEEEIRRLSSPADAVVSMEADGGPGMAAERTAGELWWCGIRNVSGL